MEEVKEVVEDVKIKAIYGEINCDIFIIPNKAACINKQYYIGEKLMKRSEELATENGFIYYPEVTRMVQIWCVGQGSDNMQDHGFHYKVGDKEYSFYFDSYLPESALRFHNEGDIITLKMPFRPRYVFSKDEGGKKLWDKVIDFEDDPEAPEAPTFYFTVNMKLNQRDYRYKNFGNFEEVLNTVTFH